MVPIHDTDIAQERWSQAEWEHYELWEKVEVKLRRRKSVWIIGTVLLFLMLSSIPILVDRWPKWTALSATRKLAQQIDQMKALVGASSGHEAYRVRFEADHRLFYTIEKVTNCSETSGTVVGSGNLLKDSLLDRYVLLTPEQGKEFGIPGLVDSICYDSLMGSAMTSKEDGISGFGIISVKDLTERRSDRIATLIFRGPSAELSFE